MIINRDPVPANPIQTDSRIIMDRNFFVLPTLPSIITGDDDLIDVIDLDSFNQTSSLFNGSFPNDQDVDWSQGSPELTSSTSFTLNNLFSLKFWNENHRLCDLFSKLLQDLGRDLDPYALILIVVAVVIAIGGMIAIACQCRSWRRAKLRDRKYRRQLKECHYDAEKWNDYVLDREKLTKNELLDSKLSHGKSTAQKVDTLKNNSFGDQKLKSGGSLSQARAEPILAHHLPPPTPTSAQQQLSYLLLQQHNPNSATFSPMYSHQPQPHPRLIDYHRQTLPRNNMAPLGSLGTPTINPGPDQSLLTKIVPIFRALESDYDKVEKWLPKKLESTNSNKKNKKNWKSKNYQNNNNNNGELSSQERKAVKKAQKKQEKLMKSKLSKESNRMKNKSCGKQLLVDERLPFFHVNPSFATLTGGNSKSEHFPQTNRMFEEQIAEVPQMKVSLPALSTVYETQTLEMEVTGSEEGDNDSQQDNLSQCSNKTYEKIMHFQALEGNSSSGGGLICKAPTTSPRPPTRRRRPLPSQPKSSPPNITARTLQHNHSSRRQQRPVGTMPPPRMTRRLSTKGKAPSPPTSATTAANNNCVTVTTGTDRRNNSLGNGKHHSKQSPTDSVNSVNEKPLVPPEISKNPLYSEYGDDDFDEIMTIVSEHPEQYYSSRIKNTPDQTDQKTTMMKFANSVRNLAVTPGAVLSVVPPEPIRTYQTFTRNPKTGSNNNNR